MLARYKILDRIGTGGIGVVYRAEDRSLRRPVAVKFLSDESFAKRQIRVRFLREARIAASLNHPNICTIHEVGEALPGEELMLDGGPKIHVGTPFIVLELIDGRSLDATLEESGPMPLEELLKVATQVVEGLTDAHAKDIVHRDLKPKNVMVTPSGRIKILDFGLAKPLMPAAADDQVMKTMESLSTELTHEGMVVGTVTYMSPEQAQGKAVDSRSDVFSFGVMLYEMATGKKPFEGDSATSTLAKILESEPEPVSGFRSDLPTELARIIHRCIRKDPKDRYNDTRDLWVALKDLQEETSSGAVRKAIFPSDGGAPAADEVASKKRRPLLAARGLYYALAAAAIVVIGLAAAFFGSKLIAPRPGVDPPSFQQITFTGSASLPALSPDGQYIAFVTGLLRGGYGVIVQDMAGGQQLQIFEAKWVRSLRWSPNGSEMLVSGSSVGDQVRTFLVPRLGGATRPLPYHPFVAWSPDGASFAGTSLPAKQIWFTDTSTGNTSSIQLSGSFVWVYDLDWSPTGNLLAFRTSDEKERHAIWTISTDGSREQVVVESAGALYSPRFSPEGDAIYYLSEREQTRELWKIPVDTDTGKAYGKPSLLMPGLQAGDHIAISRDGAHMAYTREMSHSNLWLVERETPAGSLRTIPLTSGTLQHGAPALSPDGDRIAFARGSATKTNIFVMSLDDGRLQQLTYLDTDNWHPVWSPNGRQIAFGSAQGGVPRVWRIGLRGEAARPFESSNQSRDLAWAPGSRILYQRQGNSNFHFIDPETEDETPLIDESAGTDAASDPLMFFSWMFSPEYSPDGDLVAINCRCPDGEGIWIVSVENGSRSLIYEGSEALPVGWSADGSSVFVMKPGKRDLVRVPASGGIPQPVMDLPFDNVSGVDITPDATRIVCNVPESQADAWLVENFDPEAE
jgi:Tol biopolymer transport system component